jgi:tetratricopeptide (TPR) repeat protein
MLGRYQQAIADFDQALRLNPQNADAINSRDLAKSALGQLEEAIAENN